MSESGPGSVSYAPELSVPSESYALSTLPPITQLKTSLKATQTQHLAPLVTSSVHGALLRSLRGLVCDHGYARACGQCPDLADCAYPWLADAKELALMLSGGQNRPGALVLRPRHFDARARRIELQAGHSLAFDVVLIGARAISFRPLVEAALQGVATRGLSQKRGPGQGRLDLLLDAITEIKPSALSVSDRYLVRLQTPLRVKSKGRIQSALGTETLWKAMVRRLRLLCAAYGEGAPDLPFAAPFQLERGDTRVVQVRRHSARQGVGMSWPGIIGELELRVHSEHKLVAEMLGFLQQVQMGKGTSFGFGAIALTPDAS